MGRRVRGRLGGLALGGLLQPFLPSRLLCPEEERPQGSYLALLGNAASPPAKSLRLWALQLPLRPLGPVPARGSCSQASGWWTRLTFRAKMWPLPSSAALLLLFCRPAIATMALACEYLFRDAFRCAGPAVQDLAALGLPNNVTQMLITDTAATELPPGLFSGMSVLQRLILSSNRLSAASPGAFRGLSRLKTLKLDNNRLGQLPRGLFEGLARLQQLVLESNQLSALPLAVFDPLLDLQELFLNKNLLAQLPKGLFRKLAKLQVLNLSRNRLAALPADLFWPLPELRRLFLYFNPLPSLPAGAFSGLGELLELRLHSCALQAIPPGAFDPLRKLQTLTLSRNRLPSLPSELFLFLGNLSLLTLHQNPLRSLPARLFGETPNLQSLWLYETELPTFPATTFANLTGLEMLVLTRNPRLSALPREAFWGLRRLQTLSLHSNSLSSLAGGTFAGLENLREVSLFGNQFEDLPRDAFGPLGRLETLYLNSTGLRSLPGDVFASLPGLQSVWLDGNPWHCHCRLGPFVAWLRKNPGLVWNATAVTCHDPQALRHTPVLAVPEAQFVCLATPDPASQTSKGSTRSPSPWTTGPLTQTPLPATWPGPSSFSSTEMILKGKETGPPLPPATSQMPSSSTDPGAAPKVSTPLARGQRWRPFGLWGPIGWVFFSLHLLVLLTQAFATALLLWACLCFRRIWRRRGDRGPARPLLVGSASGGTGGGAQEQLGPPVYCTLGLVLASAQGSSLAPKLGQVRVVVHPGSLPAAPGTRL